MKNKFLTINISIAVLLISGSVFYYYVIFLPQKEQIRIEQQRQEQLTKENREKQALEQEFKEYVAKRKMECYDIGQKERENWNNVDDSFYDREEDVCVVRYKNLDWREGDPNSCELFEGLFDDEESDCTIRKYFKKEF